MLMFLLGTVMGLAIALISINQTTKHIYENLEWITVEEAEDEEK